MRPAWNFPAFVLLINKTTMKIYLRILFAIAILLTQVACERKETTTTVSENELTDSLIASLN